MRILFSLMVSAVLSSTALAQTDEIETAKPYDTVSPTGVSYTSGTFTHNPDVVSIGEGDFPHKLTYGLRYDSRGNSVDKDWSESLFLGVTGTVTDTGDDGLGGKPNPNYYTWSTNIVAGPRKEQFERFGSNRQTTYTPGFHTGSTLRFIGTNWAGHYEYIGSGGEKFEISEGSGANDGTITKLTYPDGTIVSKCPIGVRCWYTNRGLAIIVQVAGSGLFTVCAVNLAQYDLNALSACPAGVQTASISSNALTTRGFASIYSVTFPDTTTETYQYNGGVLACILPQGQSTCRVANTYQVCTPPPPYNNDWVPRVTQQTFATGEMIQYVYSGSSAGYCTPATTTMTQVSPTLGNAVTSIGVGGSQVVSATSPIGKTATQTWTGNTNTTNIAGEPLLASATAPEGNQVVNTYDSRGNLTSTRRKAKPGTGLADIVTSAAYPVASTPYDCPNRVTCNKPTSTTDARGHVTDYTYDATHGGVLTKTGPADANGVRPQTRYSYVQRYAWVKSGSGYAPAASPVWLLASEAFCRTSAASGGGCAAGASDQVVTTYDYGPNSGPNNLWLRGKVVTADGLSLRTCYQRDGYGRVIAETSPNANLASCP